VEVRAEDLEPGDVIPTHAVVTHVGGRGGLIVVTVQVTRSRLVSQSRITVAPDVLFAVIRSRRSAADHADNRSALIDAHHVLTSEDK
jgi:hypothetical protein